MDLNGLVDKVKELQGHNESLARQLERTGREHSERRAALRDLCVRQEAEIGRLIAEVAAAARDRAALQAELATARQQPQEQPPPLATTVSAEPAAAEAKKVEEVSPTAGRLPSCSSCPDFLRFLDAAAPVGAESDAGAAADAVDAAVAAECRRRRRPSLQEVGAGAAASVSAGSGRRLAASAVAGCRLCPSWHAENHRLRRDIRRCEDRLAAAAAQRELDLARAAELAEALDAVDTRCRRSDAAHAEKLDDLSKQLSQASARMTQLRDQLAACKSGLGDQLACLIRDRDQLQEGIEQLQGWYDSLLSARRESADSMRQGLLEGIPAAVDELQVLVLKLKEDLISERVNREHLDRRYQSEAAFERQKLQGESEQLRQTQEYLQSETDRCDRLRSELGRERAAREAAQAQLAALQEKSREVAGNLRASEADLRTRVTRLETANAELRHKVQCLQTELHNSESVQKDFVELSQSLQVQLENLRQQESQVRWQFLEDAASCGACGRALSLAVRPRRCLHCVRIFCHDCTAKTVASGPKQRTANVCEFCHTLVVKDAVPYFSVKAPSGHHGPK